eukprot:179192-Alexandrium_andersonii.AAC.1
MDLFAGRIRELRGAGLHPQSAVAMATTYINGRAVHLQRAADTRGQSVSYTHLRAHETSAHL